jgi:hypothetical protein
MMVLFGLAAAAILGRRKARPEREV